MRLYLSAELLAMPLRDIKALHLTREWNRLRQSGGHYRKSRKARPLSAKSVRKIAGLVSSAFVKAIAWGLAEVPAINSERPKSERKEGIALTRNQQNLVLQAAEAHWALPTILELAAATGARRGEILALRWSDVVDGRAVIARSLTQTKSVLAFKTTKSGKSRLVTLPQSVLRLLQTQRNKQGEFRLQFGEEHRGDLDLIAANPDGTPLRPDSILSAVSLLFRRLKLPAGASLHTLRHTHGSHLLAAGMELSAVSARLGHSSAFVTASVYSPALSGRDDEAAIRWEAFQERPPREASDELKQWRIVQMCDLV